MTSAVTVGSLSLLSLSKKTGETKQQLGNLLPWTRTGRRRSSRSRNPREKVTSFSTQLNSTHSTQFKFTASIQFNSISITFFSLQFQLLAQSNSSESWIVQFAPRKVRSNPFILATIFSANSTAFHSSSLFFSFFILFSIELRLGPRRRSFFWFWKFQVSTFLNALVISYI